MKATILFRKTPRFFRVHPFLGIMVPALVVSAISWQFLSPRAAQAVLQSACQLPTFQKVGAITAGSASDVSAADFNEAVLEAAGWMLEVVQENKGETNA